MSGVNHGTRLSATAHPTGWSPPHIDLGLILARDDRPDEATHLGLPAAESGWMVASCSTWRVHELDTMLAARRVVPEVTELREPLEPRPYSH